MTMQMMHAVDFTKQIDQAMHTLKMLKVSDPEDKFYSGYLAYVFEVLERELGEEELKRTADIIQNRFWSGRW